MTQKSLIPNFIYGTAWKGNTTATLVETAVNAGFIAIDTANQPKHYSETGVGDALLALQKTGITRKQLFLQTKFTFVSGQDERIPYDPTADFKTQVQQSFESSLQHLHTDYLDSYILHGPYYAQGLSAVDWGAWRAIEALYSSGKVKHIGISNVNVQQLELLIKDAQIKPHFVQNRCYAVRGWDKKVREFCKLHDIHYQGFSLLTANMHVLAHPFFLALSEKYKKTPEQIIFRFAYQIGMIPLTGTTDKQHMKEDLNIFDMELTSDEVMNIEVMG